MSDPWPQLWHLTMYAGTENEEEQVSIKHALCHLSRRLLLEHS